MQVFGHRGAPGFPRRSENTIGSFRRALEAGADGFELDVRRCADGQLVVIHDATIDRTTNGSGLVRAMTYSELRRYDAGNGEPPPLLEAVLDAFKGQCTICIELKESGLAGDVVQIVEERRMESSIVMLTFDRDDGHNPGGPAWEELRAAKPPMGVGLLATPAKVERIGLEGYISAALAVNAALHVAKESVDQSFVDRAHQAGIAVKVFTVNTPEEILHCRALGVDAIFTDFPERAK